MEYGLPASKAAFLRSAAVNFRSYAGNDWESLSEAAVGDGSSCTRPVGFFARHSTFTLVP